MYIKGALYFYFLNILKYLLVAATSTPSQFGTAFFCICFHIAKLNPIMKVLCFTFIRTFTFLSLYDMIIFHKLKPT